MSMPNPVSLATPSLVPKKCQDIIPLEAVFGDEALDVNPLERLHPLEMAVGKEASDIEGANCLCFFPPRTSGAYEQQSALIAASCLARRVRLCAQSICTAV